MSLLNTRLRRCAQVIAARRSAGVGSSESPCARRSPPLPRLAGVTRARCLLLGANTPWKRVRLTLGLGTKAASRAMKSSGSVRHEVARVFIRDDPMFCHRYPTEMCVGGNSGVQSSRNNVASV